MGQLDEVLREGGRQEGGREGGMNLVCAQLSDVNYAQQTYSKLTLN